MALKYPNLSPNIVTLGPLTIRWYGLVYVMGILVARWTLLNSVKKGRLKLRDEDFKDPEAGNPIDTMIIWIALGIMLGGRLGYVLFYNFSFYLSHPLDVLKVWEGGMAFHGAFTGVTIAAILISRRFRLSFLQVADNLAFVTPICLGFGRVANFINGELAGRVTDSPLGMVFPNYGPLPRHPSQLYESILEGFGLQLFLYLNRKQFKHPGRIAGIFVLGYAVCRIIVENFREPDPQLGFIFGPLTMGQILSGFMILFGLYLIRRSQTPDPIPQSRKHKK